MSTVDSFVVAPPNQRAKRSLNVTIILIMCKAKIWRHKVRLVRVGPLEACIYHIAEHGKGLEYRLHLLFPKSGMRSILLLRSSLSYVMLAYISLYTCNFKAGVCHTHPTTRYNRVTVPYKRSILTSTVLI
jgi:hypothetical protein